MQFHSQSLSLQMANICSFPRVLCGIKLTTNTPLLNPRARNSHNNLVVHERSVAASLYQSLPRRRSSLEPLKNSKSSEESEEEDCPALETVLSLYAAIKNQNINEVSNMIGEECRCVCNFFSFFESFQGKQQVLNFFRNMMKMLGGKIEFVVKPTLHEGMNVGVSWKLEWSKTHMPLGKGFSFYICQVYHGRVLIRNVEMFMEPLLHIEPFRLRIMACMMSIAEKMSKPTAKEVILSLILMVIVLFFTKPGLY